LSYQDLILIHAPSVYDFRRKSILYGPISDLVPSTPIFEMYPIGFTTIAEHLERNGLRVRIVNLALRMLQDREFDAEASISRMDAAVFGIDLHWLPHAHGALEIARIIKQHHPDRPTLLGGFSSTYYHRELAERPEVDFVIRGDSTEGPSLDLVRYIRTGGKIRPRVGSPDERKLAAIPNLVWKDSELQSHINPLSYCPSNLDGLLLDYSYVLKSVARYRQLADFIPFRNWIRYPITAALSVRGCKYNCVSCGGSAYAYQKIHGRQQPAFRRPEDLANDIRRISRFSRGPIFVLGDIRQAGNDYVDHFLDAIAGYKGPVFLELFDAARPEFFKRVARSLPNFTIEISLESHDDRIRRAFGRPYSTEAIERTIASALNAGCKRLDLFFMVGLPMQTYDSVMQTVEYCEKLLSRHTSHSDTRLTPFISPLAPFLDPGSRAFEEPERYGYYLFQHTLEDHRQALLSPSWKYALNYETKWMDRNTIVASTYEAARRLNILKAKYGLVSHKIAAATDKRIARAVALSQDIDQIMQLGDLAERTARLQDLKSRIEKSSLSTVCDKRELELPIHGSRIKWLSSARVVVQELWQECCRR
jgi:B12-binding domain/radical SAM domain protein